MNKVTKLSYFAETGTSTVERLFAYVGGSCILAVALVVTFDVILRYLFRAPTSWSLEIIGYLMVACIFLPLSLTQAEGKQISVDLLRSRLSQRLMPLVDLIVSAITLGFFILLTVKSLDMAIFSYQHNLVSSTVTRMPLFPSQIVVTIGAFMLSTRLVFQIWHHIALLLPENFKRYSN